MLIPFCDRIKCEVYADDSGTEMSFKGNIMAMDLLIFSWGESEGTERLRQHDGRIKYIKARTAEIKFCTLPF